MHPWVFEPEGLLVDHCLMQFHLIESDMHVTIQQNNPDGQGLTTLSHVDLELAEVNRVRYAVQRRAEVALRQCSQRHLVQIRRRRAGATVAAQLAVWAELAGPV